MFDDTESVKKINTREDFSKFTQSLSADFYDSPQSWMNRDIDAYLEALVSCLESSTGEQKPSWQSFAELLLCAKTYKK